MLALFPEPSAKLHLFSGSLDELVEGVRFDVRLDPAMDAHRLSFYYPGEPWVDLTLADPPYSKLDAERYGTPMVHRKKVLHELAKVTLPGGHVAWLDTVLPMFTKREWHWWGVIDIVRSTNHRVRNVFMFERVG